MNTKADHLIANWNYPTNMKVGSGRISELPDACRDLGMTSPLLVTDSSLAELPIVAAARKACQAGGIDCAVFSGVEPNPTGDSVSAGVAAYHSGSHDGVIAFGGGSGIDAAKAIALMVGQQRPLWDFEDLGDNWMQVDTARMAPVVAIPTTAGTGSEVGRASVISDPVRQVKKLIYHPNMLPGMVILDPQLTVGLPAHITAATGMDALSHSLEAYCSPVYHPMAEGIAMQGMRLVLEFLPRAVANGGDLEARMQMLAASSMGATAFQKGLGGMHAISHTLGALYGAHHGLLNAILMPYVLVANREVISDKIARLANYLELAETDFDGFLQQVLAMRETLGIPHSLLDIDINDSEAARVGDMSAVDPAGGGNPIPFDAHDYAAIFLKAVRGEL